MGAGIPAPQQSWLHPQPARMRTPAPRHPDPPLETLKTFSVPPRGGEGNSLSVVPHLRHYPDQDSKRDRCTHTQLPQPCPCLQAQRCGYVHGWRHLHMDFEQHKIVPTCLKYARTPMKKSTREKRVRTSLTCMTLARTEYKCHCTVPFRTPNPHLPGNEKDLTCVRSSPWL